jgi:hypothetical protein
MSLIITALCKVMKMFSLNVNVGLHNDTHLLRSLWRVMYLRVMLRAFMLSVIRLRVIILDVIMPIGVALTEGEEGLVLLT